MKQKILKAIVALILATVLPAWGLNIPPTLRDELTGSEISDGTRNLVICIHGWNPTIKLLGVTLSSAKANKYTEEYEWDWLVFNLRQALPGSSSDPWALLLYHWEADADTGFIDTSPSQFGYYWQVNGNAARSAQFAWEHGISLGARLPSSLRRVHIIAHSAGTWCAYQTASALIANNPYLIVQVTLLDPYVPDEVPGLGGSYPSLSKSTINGMTNWPSGFSARFSLLENYVADDAITGVIPNFPNNFVPAFPTIGTQTTFSWRAQDINLQVDWRYSFYPYRTEADAYYDWHSGPILFYGDTIEAANGGTIESGLPPTGLPFDYNLNGWKQSLFYKTQSGLLSTKITTQPQRTTSVASGTSVTLTVGATSSLPFNFQWFKRGQDAPIAGATFGYYTFTASTANAGDYVVRIRDLNGNMIFSDFATVTVTGVSPPPTAPSIASVSPSTLPTSFSTQLINIYGSNFNPSGANASTLIFRDPTNGVYVRTPTYVSASQLQYNITVQSAVGTWSVTVTNAGQAASNLKTFLVQATTPSAGSLVVNLSPAGAVSAGAQWRVDGGSYQNSGDVVVSLTPGSHTVSFKSVSGYTAPVDQTANIVANAQTTINASYTTVTATTYTLTTFSDPAQGSVSPNPSRVIYSPGETVALTAYNQPGWHLSSWSGDAGGSANPVSVLMNGNKTVTANWASGDLSHGAINVTIQPPEAAGAGAQFSIDGGAWQYSGTTLTGQYLGDHSVKFMPLGGWTTPPVQTFVVNGGATTYLTGTYSQPPQPTYLQVVISPANAVTAGAQWRVDGGTWQNSGVTLSISSGATHLVEFNTISGWSAPPSQTVSIGNGQTRVVSGVYNPPPGIPLVLSLNPTVGALAGGTPVTIKGANFTAPATVTFGGISASSVVVNSATQIIATTPNSASYGSAAVVVQTPGGNATNLNGFAYGFPRGTNLTKVGAIGGTIDAVAVQGSYAYIGEGASFVVLNVSNPDAPAVVTRLALPGNARDIALSGNYAYVADDDSGLQVVDIVNPLTPTLRGYFDTPGQSYGVALLGGRAYVADGDAGLQILDLGNPIRPTFMGATNIGGIAKDIVIKATTNGLFAYIIVGSTFKIIDVGTPTSPSLRSSLSLPEDAGSLTISGNRAYLGDSSSGFLVIDITNPNAPVNLGRRDTGNALVPTAVVVSGNKVYAAGILGFGVFDAPSDVFLYASTSLGFNFTGRNIAASGNFAYLADQQGFYIFDASNPSAPVKRGVYLSTSGAYSSVAISGSYAYLGAQNKGIKVVNIADPSLPSLTGTYPNDVDQVIVSNGRLYTSSSAAGVLSIYNISNPNSLTLLGSIPQSVIFSVAHVVNGDIVYDQGFDLTANPYTEVLATFRAANPSSPSLLIKRQLEPNYTTVRSRTIAIQGNRLCVANSGGTGVMRIFDVSNPSNPNQQGIITGLGDCWGMALSADGRYAYVGDGSGARFSIVDMINPANPVLVSSNFVGGGLRSIVVQNGLVYLAAGAAGVQVYDVSTPSHPVLLRSYDTPGYAFDLAVNGDYLYVADFDGGLIILNIGDIEAPQVFITNPVFDPAYTNATATINLGGGATDNKSVSRVSWSNSRGGGGDATGTDNWLVNGITLQSGSNILTVTAFDAAGNNANDTLAVIYNSPKANQTVTFSNLVDRALGDAPFALTGWASSGLPVTFNIISGSAIVSSNVVSVTGTGVITIRASQAGDASFNAAANVDRTFTVTKASQVITFGSLANKLFGDLPFTVNGSASSGLAVTFSIVSGPATINSNVVTLTGASTVIVRASQSGNTNFNAAANVDRGFTVAKLPQFITFGALSRQVVGDAPFAVSASAGSGLPVSFSVLAGPAVVSGNIVTVTGSGLAVLRAAQAGNTNFAAAPNVDQVLIVAPGNNIITDSQRLANGMFTFRFYGEMGTNYLVQASTNLVNWLTVATNQVSGLGYMEFTDTSATNFSKRFYRIAPLSALASSGAPVVTIQLTGGKVVVSWPTNATGYFLEYTTNFPAATWISNTPLPSIVGIRYAVTNSATNKFKLYRLKK